MSAGTIPNGGLGAVFPEQIPGCEAGKVSGHTPGPWVANERNVAGVIEITADDYYIADVIGGLVERQKANAHLIAAAPELLEACKAQHRAIDLLMARLIALDPEFMPTKSNIWPAVVLGSEAIARAQQGGSK